MKKLIILAYNESAFIKKVIEDYLGFFDEIIVVNDKSRDNTENILKQISAEQLKVKVINNKKNYGAGKSFQIGLEEALKSDFEILVKIDGDGQFSKFDVLNIIKFAESNKVDFIKCDRFWKGGIKGKIPNIRYFGNAFASLLIKFSTSNNSITDPLNGLFLFSHNAVKELTIPRIFNRYGYPFFINNYINKLSFEKNLNLYQYKNIVSYGEEKSNINAFLMFLKLVSFSFYGYLSLIIRKIRISQFQLSGILDSTAIILFFLSLYCLLKALLIRYFTFVGNQGAWIILFLFFEFLSILLISVSRKNVQNSLPDDFKYIEI